MKKYRFNQLSDIKQGHFLADLIPGKYIYKGKLDYGEPGKRTHSFDGPDGKDYHLMIDKQDLCVFFWFHAGEKAHWQ